MENRLPRNRYTVEQIMTARRDTAVAAPHGQPVVHVCRSTSLDKDIAHSVCRHVFKHRDGRAWGAVRTAFETTVERTGLEHFRFHDLQLTCPSHMVMRDRTLREVQEVLRHQCYAMTLRYTHLSPGHLQTAVEALEELTPAHGTARPLDGMAQEMAQIWAAPSDKGRVLPITH